MSDQQRSLSTIAPNVACIRIETDPEWNPSFQEPSMNGIDSATNGTSQSSTPERTYQSTRKGAYYLPNDTDEHKRLNLQHRALLLTLGGGLHIAPLTQTTKTVLDIGTGTGIWAYDFARANPSTIVHGMDLSPPQVTQDQPENFKFSKADAEKPWVFAGETKYDFVHSRLLMLGIHDWPTLLSRAFDSLEPGGWCELQEIANPAVSERPEIDGDSTFGTWTHAFAEANRKSGKKIQVVKSLPELMTAAGFVDVRYERPNWPIGGWAKGDVEKEIGEIALEDTLQLLNMPSNEFWKEYMDWDEDKAAKVKADAREELEAVRTGGGSRWCWELGMCCGQKPIVS